MNRRRFIGTTAGAVTGLTLVTGSATADSEIKYTFERGVINSEGNVDWIPQEIDPSLFDLEDFKVTGNGRVLHHELPLGDGKPYTLLLEDEEKLLYTQRGANTNFEDDGEDSLFPEPGNWRGVVREEVGVGLDDEEFVFGHSVTRVDFFAQQGMQPDGAFVLGLGAFDKERFEAYKDKDIPNPGGNEPGSK